MKYIVLVLSFVFAMNANAGLITNVFTSGNQLFVDFSLNNIQQDTYQTTAEYLFDDSQLEFSSYTDSVFMFDNFVGFGSGGVIPNGDSSLFFVDFVFFDDAFNFGPSFELGQAVFNILDNTVDPVFVEDKVENLNKNGAPHSEVPAPSGLVLFSLTAGLLLMRQRKQA
ncbi:PEP-CTERM sorting domain-containing protein [Paraglaciecola aquimarina]|uniref:PEP-CTERM sorting domain-containing protein n=1 Tax=Paraglaciecola algarum TaxID=3050085 RepID=A0ABS9D8Y5_9ALTE|nr:PEP-CTERM sorting domain-containing protein [Paraglaciecola sp. G1-23]MCF2948840.1 PEP-CTERM sorting domain-containing protein [Paraglaciecola sp. G1-23]